MTVPESLTAAQEAVDDAVSLLLTAGAARGDVNALVRAAGMRAVLRLQATLLGEEEGTHTVRTLCGPVPSECDLETGEPCANHERDIAHAEGEHCFCGPECATGNDAAMQALSDAGAQCGNCGDQPGDRVCPDCERHYQWCVDALRKAGWAPRAETLREAAEVAVRIEVAVRVARTVGSDSTETDMHASAAAARVGRALRLMADGVGPKPERAAYGGDPR